MTQKVLDDPFEFSTATRCLWLVPLLVPLSAVFGIWMERATGLGIFAWLSVFLWYAVVPALDWLFGNYPRRYLGAEVQRQLEADPFYRWLAMLLVPVHYIAFVASIWLLSYHPLTWSLVGHTIAIGLVTSLAINLGHELGHKQSRLEMVLAKFVLALGGYGHFRVEHNRGHHRKVATPDDPASARFGESIYAFAQREIPGNWQGAWESERSRLAKNNKSPWTTQNEILQPLIVTATLYAALTIWLGVPILFVLIAQAAVAWWQLTSSNYVEHYGLLRPRRPDGGYGRCGSEHSWNSDALVSNLALLSLQRHSDHHVHPARPFQALRNFDVAPQLPAGYPLLFLAALIPPVWQKIMDHRVLELVKGDTTRVNMNKARKADRHSPNQVPRGV